MLTNIFESRNKTFLNLVKLGDYLGRSLRESVELFSVDNDTVTYLTESKNIIRGKYKASPLSLTDIEVQSSELFEDKKLCNQLVDKKISHFLADLLENDLSDAKNSFDGILGLWETKLQFDRTQKRLTQKAERFDESTNILGTPEFLRLYETKAELIKTLQENKEFVMHPEVRNIVRMSSLISKSFDLPRLKAEDLVESTYTVPQNINTSLYDHLCKQEILAQELVESKKTLDTIWITNEKIQKLPSFIYESDDNIMHLVAEIVSELPYFAMASKKQLTTLVEGNLDLLVEDSKVPAKDIKEFVAKIFEFKKPVKNFLLDVLNEKYGVNVQDLTATPTFDSLIKSQAIIFESLSKLSPKDSNLRRVLVEFAQSLRQKSGVESIDVSDFLSEVFDDCGYSESLNETSLLNYLNFDKVADDLGKIGQVLKMIQAGVGGGDAAGALAAAMGGGQGDAQGMAQEVPEGEGEYEEDGGELAGMEDEAGGDMEGDSDMEPAMDAEDAASEVSAEEEMEGEEGGMGAEEEGMGDEEGEVELSDKEDILDSMKELEELIATLKGDLGVEGEEGMGEEGEEMEEEGDGEEGEMPEINTGEGEDEVHIDVDSHNDEEEDEEEESDEEEEMPKKKSKKPEME